MRQLLIGLALLLLAGCVGQEPGSKGALPSDLRTSGTDWPSFLGPTGDSVSSEKGIVTSWPKEGPRLLWHKKLGTGYAMPSISRGRMFLFERVRNQARMQACKSETGEFLWVFEYPTDFQDKYGYNNGPRCCPVVDDDRVYIHGAEGMLHCLRAVDGKLLWKVDTAAEFGVIQNFFGVGSTPVVEDDLLLVMVGGSPKDNKDVDFGDLKVKLLTSIVAISAIHVLESFMNIDSATEHELLWGIAILIVFVVCGLLLAIMNRLSTTERH